MRIATLFLDGLGMVNRAGYYLIGMLLIVMAVSTLFQVLVRFVFTAVGFNFSAPWTEEVARYAMIWVVFIGMGIGCRHAQLISLEFMVNRLPGMLGQLVRYLALGICLVFFAVLVTVGLEFVEFGRIERSPAMSMPKSWIYWAMPVGAALAFINTVALCLEAWSERKDIREPSGIERTLRHGASR